MKKLKILLGLTLLLLVPGLSKAEGITDTLTGMQPVLDHVYQQMLPLCAKLIDVAQGIAGFAALWYIGSRVWKQIAQAEPIEFYPLIRPFALGIAIGLFQTLVIPVMNGVLQPVVAVTNGMMKDSNSAITQLLKQKQDAVKNSTLYQIYVGDDGNGSQEKWYKYTHPDDPNGNNEGIIDGLGNDIKFFLDKQSYNFRNSIKQWMAEVLEVVYAASSLCINTLRVFFLIVLAILGPLVFGLSVFDGFQHSLTQWFARYINIFLWLPIANIFGSIIGQIQQEMLKMDIAQIQSQGDTFFNQTNVAYLVFLLIGIVGYFSVPTVANFVVHAHGHNGMLQRVSSVAATTVSTTGSIAGAAGSRALNGAGNITGLPGNIADGYSGKAGGKGTHGAAGRATGKTGAYVYDKLSGH